VFDFVIHCGPTGTLALFPRIRALIFIASIAGFLTLHLISDYVRFLQGELTFAPCFLLGTCLYGATLGTWSATLAAIPCFIAIALHFKNRRKNEYRWAQMVVLLPVVIILLSRVRPGQRFHAVDKWLGDLSYPSISITRRSSS
jgi:hypothetical protein